MYQIDEMNGLTEHDAEVALKAISRICSQPANFGLDPQIANNTILSKFYI